MEEIKLSIVICTYNRANLLVEALESAIQQKTTFPFEVIVGDDCSTDETRPLLRSYSKKYPKRIVLSFMGENSGIGANWATAVMKARGQYVAFLDDDDYWTDDMRMQIMVDYLEKYPEIDLLYTNGYTWNTDSNYKELIVYPKPEELDVHKVWQGKQPNFQLNMVMIRKKLIEMCICLEDYVKFKFPIQDWNTHILLLRKAKCAFMDMPTCILRMTKGSLSRPVAYEEVKKKFDKEKVMYNYLADQFPDDPIICHDDKGFDSYVNHILLSIAYKRDDYIKAKYYSKLSGGHSLKEKCAHTWMTFHTYRLFQRIMRRGHCCPVKITNGKNEFP